VASSFPLVSVLSHRSLQIRVVLEIGHSKLEIKNSECRYIVVKYILGFLFFDIFLAK